MELLLEHRDDLLGKDGEHGIGLSATGDRDAIDGSGSLLQQRSHGVGVHRVASPQLVVEQCEQLRADEAHLARQLHRGLAKKIHAGCGLGVQDDDSFAEHEAILGPAKRQDVDADIRGECT